VRQIWKIKIFCNPLCLACKKKAYPRPENYMPVFIIVLSNDSAPWLTHKRGGQDTPVCRCMWCDWQYSYGIDRKCYDEPENCKTNQKLHEFFYRIGGLCLRHKLPFHYIDNKYLAREKCGFSKWKRGIFHSIFLDLEICNFPKDNKDFLRIDIWGNRGERPPYIFKSPGVQWLLSPPEIWRRVHTAEITS